MTSSTSCCRGRDATFDRSSDLRESIAQIRTALGSLRPYAVLDASFATIDDVVAAAPSLAPTEGEAQVALVRLFGAHVRDTEACFATVTPLGLPALTAAS